MNTKTTFPLPVEHVVIGHFEGEAPVTRIILATDDDQASENLEALVRQETGEDYENVEFHIDTVSLVSIVCANPLTYYGHTIDRKSMFIATVHAENDSAYPVAVAANGKDMADMRIDYYLRENNVYLDSLSPLSSMSAA